MQEKAGKFDEALESLMQSKQILEDNYGLVDKRTTRVKRNISLIRLKLGMIPEALQEMKEVEVRLWFYYEIFACTVKSAVINCLSSHFFRNWNSPCTVTAL